MLYSRMARRLKGWQARNRLSNGQLGANLFTAIGAATFALFTVVVFLQQSWLDGEHASVASPITITIHDNPTSVAPAPVASIEATENEDSTQYPNSTANGPTTREPLALSVYGSCLSGYQIDIYGLTPHHPYLVQTDLEGTGSYSNGKGGVADASGRATHLWSCYTSSMPLSAGSYALIITDVRTHYKQALYLPVVWYNYTETGGGK